MPARRPSGKAARAAIVVSRRRVSLGSGRGVLRDPAEHLLHVAGHAAISLLWAQDWLSYFRWMAVHSQPAGADDPSAHEARPVR